MQITSIKKLIALALCALLLMQESTLLLAEDTNLSDSNSPSLKSISFMQMKAKKFSVPLQISPIQIEAPPRRIDLQPEYSNKITSPLSVRALNGFPANLHDYPILNFGTKDIGSTIWGFDLVLDTQTVGVPDTLVHIGDPTLFPAMIDMRIDFRTTELVPKGLIYSLKRKVGLGYDEKWRYTPQGVAIKEIGNGVVRASFSPGGALTLAKAIDSLNIEKTPWLNFEYTMPTGSSWYVQINAKVETDGIGQNLTLLSPPYKGGGKQKLLLNLNNMLHEANSHAKGGRLKELLIHFVLDKTSTGIEDASVKLGHLEFYRVQQPPQGSMLASLLVVPDGLHKINLADILHNHLSSASNLHVLRGNLVDSSIGTETNAGAWPEISIQANFREKLPKLFAGEDFYLDDLNGKELSDVLDRRLFLEKQVLWQSGRSDLLFLNPLFSFGAEGLLLPLINFAPNVSLGDNAYIDADFAFEGGGEFPLYLTLRGIDHQGRQVRLDRLLSKKTPLKIGDIKLKNITISYWQANSSLPPPPSLMIKNIQISTFKKTAAYRSKSSSTVISIDGGSTPLDVSRVIWEAVPEKIEFDETGSSTLQTIERFTVKQKIVGEAFIGLNIENSNSEPCFIRVKGSDKNGYFEKLIPVLRQGTLRIQDMDLLSLDLIVQEGVKRAHSSVQLNQLNLSAPAKSAMGAVVNLRDKTIYLVPHYSPLKTKMVEHPSDLAKQYIDQDMLNRMHTIDTSLSYGEILHGGRLAKLPETFIYEGPHKLDYLANEEISLNFESTDFLKIQSPSIDEGNKNVGIPIVVPTIVWLILAATFFYVAGSRLIPSWLPPNLHPFIYDAGFWIVEFFLLIAGTLLVFKTKSQDALSWGEFVLVVAYGFAVRHKIRPYLGTYWSYFTKRSSAPYFILFFILLFTCAFLLMFHKEVLAGHMAEIGYYLLITGTAIEFIQFSRDNSVVRVK